MLNLKNGYVSDVVLETRTVLRMLLNYKNSHILSLIKIFENNLFELHSK